MFGVTYWAATIALGASGPDQDPVGALVRLTNKVRAEFQASPLDWDGTAAKVARAHADDMVARRFFSHVAPDGSTLLDRVLVGGLTGFSAVGENLGAGSQDPRVMMRLWLESGGHRKNILDHRFTHIGIGHVPGSRPAESVWCVVFVAR
jgi:uncharacterized protein YkwD